MTQDKHVIQLHYFLLRDSVTDYKQAVNSKKDRPRVIKGRDDVDFESELYIFSQKKTPPTWLNFLQTGISELEHMENRHNSAILFVRTKKARFAIPFGYGHTRINLEEVYRDFGRRVVINTVKRDGISLMDRRDFNEISMSHKEESSHGARQELFGVNAEAELLNAIAGVPEDPTLGKRMAGAEGLKLSRAMEYADLGVICLRLLEAYKSKAYQKRGFDWVDNLSHVKEKKRIGELDELLVADLKSGSTAVQISAPGYFNRDKVAYYLYSTDPAQRMDRCYLSIEDWHAVHQSKYSRMTPDILRKRWQVEAMDDSGGFVERANMMDVFIHEVTLANTRYVLSSGKWYEVQKKFIASMNRTIREITASASHLPLAKKGDEEDLYIKELAKRSDLVVFHKQKGKNFKSGRGAVEPCDVYWHDGRFMHIKRWYSSASFGHCLNQGLVSALTCNSSPDFRKHMVRSLGNCPAATKRPFEKSRFTTSELTVSFAALRNIKLDLPFFSKVTLVTTARQIQAIGYQVEYLEIKDKP